MVSEMPAESGMHQHIDENGNVYYHEHSHGDADGHGHSHGHSHTHGDEEGSHNHSHTHDPETIRKIINRLSRSIGHLERVREWVREGRDCADVLIQLSAVNSEISSTARLLLKEHMEHCIVEAVEQNDQEALDKLNKAVDIFMKKQ